MGYLDRRIKRTPCAVTKRDHGTWVSPAASFAGAVNLLLRVTKQSTNTALLLMESADGSLCTVMPSKLVLLGGSGEISSKNPAPANRHPTAEAARPWRVIATPAASPLPAAGSRERAGSSACCGSGRRCAATPGYAGYSSNQYSLPARIARVRSTRWPAGRVG
jgi:hypothetical protein